jgi:hypothetical protein
VKVPAVAVSRKKRKAKIITDTPDEFTGYDYQVINRDGSVIETGQSIKGLVKAVGLASEDGGTIIERIEVYITQRGDIRSRGIPIAMSIGRSGFWIHIGACRPLERVTILDASLALSEEGKLHAGSMFMDREASETIYRLNLDVCANTATPSNLTPTG